MELLWEHRLLACSCRQPAGNSLRGVVARMYTASWQGAEINRLAACAPQIAERFFHSNLACYAVAARRRVFFVIRDSCFVIVIHDLC